MACRVLTYLVLSLLAGGLNIFQAHSQPAKIQWESFESLDSLLDRPAIDNESQGNQYFQKKILLYLYTDWCVYCRKMDAAVFTDPEIKSLLQKFHAVKFDAESTDTIRFDGAAFARPAESQFHYLATALGNRNGEMLFPTLIVLDPDFKIRAKNHQYLSRKQLKAFLKNALE